ncbi:MAG: hypothetical protein ACTHMJ_01025 [Thermomicrobiales bacterium]
MPQHGDVALYAPDDSNELDRLFIAAQAAAGYTGRWVHCELFLDDNFLVGAVMPRVRLGPVGKLAPAKVITPPWTDADGPRKAAEYAADQVGVLYDGPGVVAFGLGLVAPAWRHVLATSAAPFDAHLLWCSALVTNALLAGGLTPPDPASASSPAALAAWLGVP